MFDKLMSVIGGGSGGFGSSIGGMLFQDWLADENAEDQYHRSLGAMREQSDINREMYKNRYLWTKEDMYRAGLNPILAASGGFSVGSGPSVGLPSPSMASLASAQPFSTSVKEFTEADLNRKKSETEKERKKEMAEQVKLTGNKAKEALANTIKLQAEKGLITDNQRKVGQEILNLNKKLEETQANINLMNNQIDELNTRSGLQKLQGSQAKAITEFTEDNKRYINEQRRLVEQQRQVAELTIERMYKGLAELTREAQVYDGPAGLWLKYLQIFIGALGIAPIAGAMGIKKPPVNIYNR